MTWNIPRKRSRRFTPDRWWNVSHYTHMWRSWELAIFGWTNTRSGEVSIHTRQEVSLNPL